MAKATTNKSKSVAKKGTKAKSSTKAGGATLTAKEEAIVVAIGSLAAAGHNEAKREVVQGMSGFGKTPESFKKSLGTIKKKGYIQYPSGKTLGLTDQGKKFYEQKNPMPVTTEDFHEKVIKNLLNKKQIAIFDFIADGGEYNKLEVAKKLDYDMNRLSGYEKDLSKMKTLGFLNKTKTTISLTDYCFPFKK